MGNITFDKLDTEEIELSQNSFSRITSKEDTQTKVERFPILFQWDSGGSNVYLTGSFCDWKQFFEMENDEEDKKKYNLTLYLPKGIYQYKFKIDEQWKCNSNYPTCRDKNGNINNYIDLTKQPIEELTTDFSTHSLTLKDEKKNDEIFSNFQKDINFKCHISSFHDNEPKPEIEEHEGYFTKRNKITSHEYINHMSSYDSFLKKKNNIIKSSCSIRYGFKISTFIYYKAKNSENNM